MSKNITFEPMEEKNLGIMDDNGFFIFDGDLVHASIDGEVYGLYDALEVKDYGVCLGKYFETEEQYVMIPVNQFKKILIVDYELN